jgi:hypothetical protein
MLNLTAERIDACKTEAGGFTRATVKALGVSWPLEPGWKKRITGLQISETRYNAARIGKYKKAPRPRGGANRKQQRRPSDQRQICDR